MPSYHVFDHARALQINFAQEIPHLMIRALQILTLVDPIQDRIRIATFYWTV
jgi:hypothetical protein